MIRTSVLLPVLFAAVGFIAPALAMAAASDASKPQAYLTVVTTEHACSRGVAMPDVPDCNIPSMRRLTDRSLPHHVS